MKRKISLLIVLLIAGVTMATSKAAPSELADTAVELCSVSCSVEVGGITYTVRAGNIFTSCETATVRCASKLADVVAALQ